MIICDTEKCTGCRACMNTCHQNAISFIEDEKGFSYPVIDSNCVECGACVKICPRNTGMKLNENEPIVYAAFSKNKSIREKSSSGGLFTELALNVLQHNGVVYASRMTPDCRKVFFDCCRSAEELVRFQGSKYVQSNPGYIFREVKKKLTMGVPVLFIGVPCQVDGLKKFLGKAYENLLTVDIICHGVPSPKLWRDYCSYLEEKNQSSICDASFRYKKPNWTRYSLKADFVNGKSVVKSKFDDPYLIAFLKEISMRENCYNCEYTSTKRTGDITLADFWGYHSYDFKMRNTDKGISLVLLNNSKGESAFEKIEDNLLFQKRDIFEAIGGNKSLVKPWKQNPCSADFWKEYIEGGGMERAFEKYCQPYRFPVKMHITWFKTNHLYLIPKPILEARKKKKTNK
ncbi:hypothetical protein DSECCO2_610970 [anaerobic digester metagenome]